jgi:predicted  nucleic acid-binding Zn-ribbon protein
MTKPPTILLLDLSKIDLSIGKLIAEKRGAEEERVSKESALRKIQADILKLEAVKNQTQAEYSKEESDLKYQQEKLNDRRKSLANLSNQKAQVAAGREIDAAQRQLHVREESLLNVLAKMEDVERQLVPFKSSAQKLEQEIQEISEGLKIRLARIEEDHKAKATERSALAAEIPLDFLKKYEGITRKNSLDPVVPIVGNSCSGCYIKLVPQVALKVAKGPGPVQCPGCSRILYLPAGGESAEQTQ